MIFRSASTDPFRRDNSITRAAGQIAGATSPTSGADVVKHGAIIPMDFSCHQPPRAGNPASRS